MTYEVRLTPNYVSPDDGVASNYQSVWVYPKSPTTPYRSPDSSRQQSRYLLLDPRARDSDGRVGQDDWWFVIERSWPADFDPNRHGSWGRQVNFHNVAGDVGWDTGSGVSALALDWLSNAPAPQFTLEYHDGGKPHYLPTPPRDAFQTYVVHFVAGRTDGTTVHPGALTVWANGSNSPVIALSNINTLQRAGGVTQKWMQLWEGDYTQNLPIVARTQFTLTRIGKTLTEALADRPVAIGGTAAGQFYTGTGVNLGAPTSTQIASRLTTDARIPTSLGGSGATATDNDTTTHRHRRRRPPTTTTPPRPRQRRRPPRLRLRRRRPRLPTPTTTPTKTSPGRAKGKNKTDRVLSSAGPALLEWDGRLFHSAADFRRHLTAKGVPWNTFLNTHPAVVAALLLPSVEVGREDVLRPAGAQAVVREDGGRLRRLGEGAPFRRCDPHGQELGRESRAAAYACRVARPEWDGIGFTTAPGSGSTCDRRGYRGIPSSPSIPRSRRSSRFRPSSGRTAVLHPAALSAWLTKHGASLEAWGAQHPAALARIS